MQLIYSSLSKNNWNKLNLPIWHAYYDDEIISVRHCNCSHLRAHQCTIFHLDHRISLSGFRNDVHSSAGNPKLPYSPVNLREPSFNYEQHMIAVHACGERIWEICRDFLEFIVAPSLCAADLSREE